MSSLKIVASQALFLICKLLPHFLYQRKAVSPARFSRSHLYFTLKIAADTYPSFAIARARVYGLAAVGTTSVLLGRGGVSRRQGVCGYPCHVCCVPHVTFAVYPTSPEMVLTFM